MTDDQNKNENDGGFWTGLIVGGLLGTVAGFFLSDDKSDLKKRLKNKAFDLWDNIGDLSVETKEKVLDFKDNAIEKAEEVERNAEEAAIIAQQKIQKIADSAQQAVEEQVAEVKKVVCDNSGSPRKKFFFRGGQPVGKAKR